MTAKELAATLNGRRISDEIDYTAEKQAKAAGFRVWDLPVPGTEGVLDLRKSSWPNGRELFFDSAAHFFRESLI